MSYLYVRENGAQISINGGYFVVLQKDGLERKIPKETLESISIFGNVTITSQCIKELLRRGIPVSYFSPGGQYFGRLQSTRHINVLRQKQQFACCADNMFSLKLSRGIIEAKISNQFILLERYIKEKTERINRNLVLMKRYREKVRHVENLNELIGFEGLAARTYFEIISELVDEEFKFSGRSRRPPKDPFNAMISLGYTLIMYEVYSALENKSLNPYAGFLHQDHINHPTLASDLIEEWRPVIVDSLVLSLIQGHEVTIDDFSQDFDTGGIFIVNRGMEVFLKKFEKKLSTQTKYLSYEKSSMSFRRAIQRQVEALTKAIEEEEPEIYLPIRIR